MEIAKRYSLYLLGGIVCAIIWWAMDRYLFGEQNNSRYYIGVIFAYITGASAWGHRSVRS